MIFYALTFVFGAFCLQQMPVLPSLYWWFTLLPFAVCVFLLRRSGLPVLRLVRQSVSLILSFVLGFMWAATYATIRLNDALPYVWEIKPIELVGVVASVPELTERGERFHFDVEKVLTDGADVPRHISLSFYPPNSWGEVQVQPQRAQPKAGNVDTCT